MPRLRHRITVEEEKRVPDGRGGHTETWEPVASIWADVEPLSTRDRLVAQQVQSDISHRVTGRYRSGLSGRLRVVHHGRYLYVVGAPINVDGRNIWLQLNCAEKKG